MKTRKILALVLCLTLCLGLLPATVLAADDFNITNGVLTSYKGPGGDVVIPYGVTFICDDVFRGCSSMTSVTIPDSVTTIGDGAFSFCNGLTSITIPDSVTDIGDEAFRDCYNLASVTIPDSVTDIGYQAFYGCNGLTSITIPNSMTTIPVLAFRECYNLASVTIPNSVTKIGRGAFRYCTSLTGVTIPNSVTEIGNEAFLGCSGLTSVTIPDSVTIIHGDAFRDCYHLTSVTIPRSATFINEYAFHECPNLTSVTIPPEVTAEVLEPLRFYVDPTIYGVAGSDAERWARSEGFNFVATQIAPVNTAYATPQTVLVDGKPVEFQCYALKDENGNDTNYIKLRDLAMLLNGTAAQFQVGWDGSVTITAKTPYTANGSELNTPFSGDRSYSLSNAVTKVNGQVAALDAFVLTDDAGGGYTYYKLRDLGKALDFNVDWSREKGVFIETDKPYASAN